MQGADTLEVCNLRTFALLGYRILLVVVLVSFFSFAALDQSVLRALYDLVTRLQTTLSSYFDFVTGFWNDGEEFSIVARAYGQTLLLLLSAVTLGSCAGLALGLAAGLRPASRIGGIASALSFAGVLTPSFLLALLVLLLFVRYINPAFGIKFVLVSPLVDVFDPRRLLPPAVVLSVRPMAFLAQVTISSLQDVIRTDYVRTAHAKGLLPWTVLFRHVMRNISTPVLTAVNSSFFFSLSSILVVEWFFSWGGVGFRLLDAVGRKDAALASYLLIAIGVTLLLINTAIKVVIQRVDGRLAHADATVS